MTVARASYTNRWTPLTAKDLVQVCTAWGFDVKIAVLAPLLQED